MAAAADASKVALDDMELLAAEQREDEAACVRQCAADVAAQGAQVSRSRKGRGGKSAAVLGEAAGRLQLSRLAVVK